MELADRGEFAEFVDRGELVGFVDRGELAEFVDRENCEMLEMLGDSEVNISFLSVEAGISVVTSLSPSSERLGDGEDDLGKFERVDP